MFFSNIKDRSLPVLEQVCERYALMVYEVFRNEVAYGFQSIRFSYENGETPGRGTFTATFVPFEDGRVDHKATRIAFTIESKSHEDDEWWELSDGKIEDLEGLQKEPVFVCFTEDGHFVVIGTWDEWSYESTFVVGNGPIPHDRCAEEELASKYKLIKSLIV